ncbi:MAG: DUF1326 domain-containing protein [Bryobacteraceae bacterium]
MKLLTAAAISALLVAATAFGAGLPATKIHGNYIEARTADVYTGPCFANSEVDLVGDLAVFGWKINQGEWRGVKLDGLSVVGVVRAKSTLGNTFQTAYPVKSVIIVDERATPEQQMALKSFAQRMSNDLLTDVVKVERAPISLEITDNNVHTASAKLSAGTLANISTRALNDGDHICTNEEVWYQPLTKVDHAMPAYTLAHNFTGSGLGTTWSNPEKRSAFVATFQLVE